MKSTVLSIVLFLFYADFGFGSQKSIEFTSTVEKVELIPSESEDFTMLRRWKITLSIPQDLKKDFGGNKQLVVYVHSPARFFRDKGPHERRECIVQCSKVEPILTDADCLIKSLVKK